MRAKGYSQPRHLNHSMGTTVLSAIIASPH
jgi:hypothetical protein